jgi:hypothetical protein
MALHIRIAARREFKSRDLWEMHKLRAKVFKDRLGWEVPIMSGMEIDGYDALEPLYMMIREPGGGPLRGCWRPRPTPASGSCRASPSKPTAIRASAFRRLPWNRSAKSSVMAITPGSTSM